MTKNPIPLYNLDLKFSIIKITSNKEASQFLFSKITGQLTGQFLFNDLSSRKIEEITKESENL